ncbi:hypothetical protein [Cesiribacter andamanensis]|uniref:Uncharacterized protein n=1 Tax=Cesiribacter andamanensis AMV16 TaxID=1279009 RepID=M7NAT5_9BACT|nr:hypothetical protein [Cesiribacter andamanensis]EMR04377.1 hypothetical protein ADICEAN_00411 [Cesiribacter andamanensis AMV16]
MQFLPTLSRQSTSTIHPQYYWQAVYRNGQQLFRLYQEEQPVASLSLPEPGQDEAALVTLGKSRLVFKDNSSFFGGQLLLLNKASGERLARIEKRGYRPGEGTIRLQEHTLGWKLTHHLNQRLQCLDQSRTGLFSYQYSHSMVRLLITKSGRAHPQLPLLLCIGLYLLPLWHQQEPRQPA